MTEHLELGHHPRAKRLSWLGAQRRLLHVTDDNIESYTVNWGL
jgi:hypothetical protein